MNGWQRTAFWVLVTVVTVVVLFTVVFPGITGLFQDPTLG